jgi:hypothetical protein
MLPAGPLSTTLSGEMFSSRQPLSVSPSDSTRELVPVTAKIAMRKSGPITTPVSLTSRNGESASLAEAAVSGRCRVGLSSGLASLRISAAAGSISADGNRAPGEGWWLPMEPNSVKINPAQTTHPTRTKAGERIICFNVIGGCQSRDFIDAPTGQIPKGEHRSLLKASNIHTSRERRALRSFPLRRRRARIQSDGPRPEPVGHSELAIAKAANQVPIRGMHVFVLYPFRRRAMTSSCARRSYSTIRTNNAIPSQIQPIVHEAEAVPSEVRTANTEASGMLHVTAPVQFGETFVAPRLVQFLERHPRIVREYSIRTKPKHNPDDTAPHVLFGSRVNDTIILTNARHHAWLATRLTLLFLTASVRHTSTPSVERPLANPALRQLSAIGAPRAAVLVRSA